MLYIKFSLSRTGIQQIKKNHNFSNVHLFYSNFVLEAHSTNICFGCRIVLCHIRVKSISGTTIIFYRLGLYFLTYIVLQKKIQNRHFTILMETSYENALRYSLKTSIGLLFFAQKNYDSNCHIL